MLLMVMFYMVSLVVLIIMIFGIVSIVKKTTQEVILFNMEMANLKLPYIKQHPCACDYMRLRKENCKNDD